MEEIYRTSNGERGTGFPSPLRAPLSQHLHIGTNTGALQTSSFQVFIEASLHRNDSLNHWPLMIRPPGPPSSQGQRGVTEISNLQMTGWFPRQPATLKCGPKSPH